MLLEVELTFRWIMCSIRWLENFSNIWEESEGKFKGILGYTEDDHSTEDDHARDLLGDRRSSIFNAMPTACSALDNNHFKFIFHCDNQWGYSCRVIDLILHMDSVQAQS
ncbi:hypothetical protein SLEP1_g58449 [Rubroshorea leprosula]|uniref:glyceraldehyde-3-phosphate dehydrogenase (phosphorylating) n=1 Tax=Rubroshorea leprosula TaxID=152421 RepID=A0AAV5MQI3_9ROSI|nr:hypothetical protein SLEP1_g58449 [Rubroshorea leprosula]